MNKEILERAYFLDRDIPRVKKIIAGIKSGNQNEYSLNNIMCSLDKSKLKRLESLLSEFLKEMEEEFDKL